MFQDIKNGRFYLGDCLEVMKEIPDGVIDMILCDLPYGTTACSWDSVIPFEPLWEQYKRIIKDNGAIVLTASQPFTSALVMSNIEMFKYEWIWLKNNTTGFMQGKTKPLKSQECVLVFGKFKTAAQYFNGVYNPQGVVVKEGKPYSNKRKKEHITGNRKNGITKETWTNLPKDRLEFSNNESNKIHPTQKPVALFEYLIKTYTNEGELVLDNCAGSGTTAIACENTGRKWVCIEQLEEYANKAVERILNHVPETKDTSIQIDDNVLMPEGEE